MIYAFECRRCTREFEVNAPMAEQVEKPQCPQCASWNTQRVLSATSFSLKGGGWASDLYTKSSGSTSKPKGE